MSLLEVRTASGWRRLGRQARPQLLETEELRLRGAEPGEELVIGDTMTRAGQDGTATLPVPAHERLRGYVGVLAVYASGRPAGEVEVLPGKLSEGELAVLRADLQRAWTDLLFDPEGTGPAGPGLPGAWELWRRLETPVADILRRPGERLTLSTKVARLETARRPGELRPALVRAGQVGRAAVTPSLARSAAAAENQAVAATLRLLRNHARRQAGADGVEHQITRMLRDPLFRQANSEPRGARRPALGTRVDPRYREVLAVRRLLDRPELSATEWPEASHGVRALSRLYEYWVFLQVLFAARRLFGAPGGGFHELAVPIRGGRWRLELPAGTTVEFPCGVHVAFEPSFGVATTGWQDIEYVPHPDPRRSQPVATPDVVIFAKCGRGLMVVLDAKYVGRHLVEGAAARMHEKYARMRWRDEPIVGTVIVAHPHTGFRQSWSGYGHVPLVPGDGSLQGSLDLVFEPILASLQREAEPPARLRPRTEPAVLRAFVEEYFAALPGPAPWPELSGAIIAAYPELQRPPAWHGAGSLLSLLLQAIPGLRREPGPGGDSITLEKVASDPLASRRPAPLAPAVLKSARAAILDYVGQQEGPLALSELGEFIARECYQLLDPPRYGGAGTLVSFVRQSLTELRHVEGPNGGTVTLHGEHPPAWVPPAFPPTPPALPFAADGITAVAQVVAFIDRHLESVGAPVALNVLADRVLERFPDLGETPRWAGALRFSDFLGQHLPHLLRLPGPGGGMVTRRRGDG